MKKEILIAIISVASVLFFLSNHFFPFWSSDKATSTITTVSSAEKEKMVMCSVGRNELITWMTEKDCEIEIARIAKLKAERLESAKAVGCESAESNGFYSCYSKDRRYILIGSQWVELDDSIKCAKYAEYKTSDLPVACLSYWGIK